MILYSISSVLFLLLFIVIFSHDLSFTLNDCTKNIICFGFYFIASYETLSGKVTIISRDIPHGKVLPPELVPPPPLNRNIKFSEGAFLSFLHAHCLERTYFQQFSIIILLCALCILFHGT